MVFAAKNGQHNGTDAGNSNLSAVGVSGELEVDGERVRIVGEVGLVGQQNGRFDCGYVLERLWKVGRLFEDVVDPGGQRRCCPRSMTCDWLRSTRMPRSWRAPATNVALFQ